jgi:hypothetical protein
MKRKIGAPNSVPRLNSLLHRLQQTPGPDDDPYLDQLMMFLDDPPPDTRDRWKEGAAMCVAWGIVTTHTSVLRLYRSFGVVWRARVALQAEVSPEKSEALAQKSAQMIALRTCELLNDPDTSPATVVSLARLELARMRYIETLRGDTERAFAVLDQSVRGNFDAQFALGQLKNALHFKPTKPSRFPFPPAVLDYLKSLQPKNSPLAPHASHAPHA